MKAIIIHGGAWNMPDSLDSAHLKGVQKACEAGRDALEDGRSSLDAVCDSLVVMEEDTTFDAGRGAFLNSAGKVELDAGIMVGKTRDFACCGALSSVRNPIMLCKKMLDVRPNTFLVGRGADEFAHDCGIPKIDNSEFYTERELSRYRKKTDVVESYFSPSDTVGAVALDDSGSIVCANTTGGTPGKPPGRVGDSPIVGCGIYATRHVGIAATGHGEPIIKTVLTKRISDVYNDTGNLEKAACQGIVELTAYGWGGIISLSSQGVAVAKHNTTKMPFAVWNEKTGAVQTSIRSKRE